ncbi:mannose-6-phosphate isomerase, class I [Fervidibacillus halotolerans]|uniref:Mannose-6-phosphate isomerase n=1 Tax=Fervidibacillus halotolerans TaxID=2980027 RepID=A0A9E8LZ83_9BACI|nr:mannose-6-phosphate isomerase, class I [Fervidibacillus halotolerans]WAA12518.1 mannose-6-phosphate isomerase, class I [Fervidibacillus halotolerans]
MKEPLFLQPVFQERIWGGTALRDVYGYEIPSDRTGECWAISGHPNGQSIVKNGAFAGKTLGELWGSNRELFGNLEGDVFPLLTKILDANADLSVQVHPDDAYAKEHENGELGKTECWYIIDCKEGAELVFGHTAKTKEEFVHQIEAGNWDQLLRRVPIKKGEFFYVPSGSIHALCEGTLVLETQQSSDTTYRVYDYDRTDANGNKRELHLDKAIDVTTIPHQDPQLNITTEKREGAEITTFVQAQYFSVYKWDIDGDLHYTQTHPFLLMSALSGDGSLEIDGKTYRVKKGDHFIIPATVHQFTMKGELELIVAHP